MDSDTVTQRLRSGGLYTQANNFLSHVSTGVDPRTGQFTLGCSLPELHANDLAGPVIKLSLQFSPLGSHRNSGFGLGWTPSFSLLDFNSDRLVINSGDSFSVDRDRSDFSRGGLLAFHDQKLCAFQVVVDDDQGRRFRVEYKDGATEYLQLQETSGVAMLVEVRSARGRKGYLDWATLGDSQRLMQIRDEERILLKVVHDTDQATLTVHPSTAQAATFTLDFLSDRLDRLTLSDRVSSWRFEYDIDPPSGLLFPSIVQGPLGSVDEVVYAKGADGHRLPPGAPLAYLPRVLHHRHDPGAGQPATYKTHTWIGNANFLGFGAQIPGGWRDGEDNLYRTDSYEYRCSETVFDSDNELLLTVERAWNRFHLQTEQVTERGGCTVRELTTYGDDPLLGWERQPAWCQLPIVNVTRYESAGASREERSTTEYDQYGNIVHQTHADGREEQTEFYPLGGAEGCPDDQGAFVRWCKRRAVRIPANEGQLEAHYERTDYTYGLLSKRHAEDRQHLVTASEVSFDVENGDAPASILVYRVEQSADSPFHGLVVQSTSTLGGFSSTTDFIRTLGEQSVHETHRRTSFDQLVFSSSSERDRLTALLREHRNENGVVTAYAYDSLGRAVQRLDNAHSIYQVTNTRRFDSTAHADGRPYTLDEINGNGQLRRITLDGDGRAVKEQIQDLNSSGTPLRELRSVDYDVLGNIIRQTSYDWQPNLDVPLCTRTLRNQYDDWGNLSVTCNPDGGKSHNHYDPITRKRVMWQQSRTGEKGVHTSIFYNLRESVERVELREPPGENGQDGALLRCETWSFNASNRPTVHTITAGGEATRSTLTRYDAEGRITERTLQDQTKVLWDFAGHTDAECIARVALSTGEGTFELLQQTFDGFDRPLARRCGDQQETLEYLGEQVPPSALVRSDGSRTEYAYEPRLNQQLMHISRPQASNAHTFTYAEPHGRVQSASSSFGDLSWRFAPTGEMHTETWSVEGQRYQSSRTYSLEGRLVSLTDAAGVETQYTYDEAGRLSGQHSAHVSLQLDYDTFGRLASTLTTDSSTLRSQQQTLTYDICGREATRQWQCHSPAGTERFRQSLSWTAHDQLASRHWEVLKDTGAVTLSRESYRYDVRGRLVQTQVQGPQTITDPRTGQPIREQTFHFNALDGYERVDTEYENGQRNSMRFFYDVGVAADRPVRITHSWPQPVTIDLEYDAAGRLARELHDQVLRRELTWDVQGNLIRQEDHDGVCSYRYDPLGRLVQTSRDGRMSRRFYDGRRVTSEQDDTGWYSLMRASRSVFAQSRLSQAVHSVLLTGCDGQGSACIETGASSSHVGYSAHGLDNGTAQSRVGYAGELREPGSTLYIAGGNRPYDPCLLMFLCPDGESPDGKGGLNRYAYCAGDPVNRIDPDGQSFWSWAGIVTGLVFGAVAVVMTGGAAIGAVMAAASAMAMAGAASSAAIIMGATASVASSLTGLAVLASAATELLAMGFTIARAVTTAQGNTAATAMLSNISLVTGSVGRSVSTAHSIAKTTKAFQAAPGTFRQRFEKAFAPNLADPEPPSPTRLEMRPLTPRERGSFAPQQPTQLPHPGGSTASTGSQLPDTLQLRESRRLGGLMRQGGIDTGADFSALRGDSSSAGIYQARFTEPDSAQRDDNDNDINALSQIRFAHYLSNSDALAVLGYHAGQLNNIQRQLDNLDPLISYL